MVKCIEEYVQVDDFKMYSKVFQGKQLQPVIIMEAGYGDYSKTWDHIAEELTEYGTVLSYDRAGLGKSGKSSKRRISSEMVKDLRSCLEQLQLKPPYIFVGHSFGGINARLFATFYPEDMLESFWRIRHQKIIKKIFCQSCLMNFKKLTINSLYMKVHMKSLHLV